MRGINLIVFSVIVDLFMQSCTSVPMSYDTAQIPEDGKNLRAGLSGQIVRVVREEGLSYRGYKVREDFQVGYGVKKSFEGGVNMGVAVGNYRTKLYQYYYYYWDYYYWDSLYRLYQYYYYWDRYYDYWDIIINQFQVDIYPYIKLGIPTDPVRFSLKLSSGSGFIRTSYVRNVYRIDTIYKVDTVYVDTIKVDASGGDRTIPISGAYIDLLFGVGNPEFLTMGLRIGYSKENPFMLILSSHLSSFTLSFMFGYFGWYSDRALNFYFGIGKAL